jgi:hypothetical protein
MRFNDILLEYDRGQTLKNYAEKILAVALKDRSVIHALIGRFPNGAIKAAAETPEGQQVILDYVMGIIEQADPTKNKNYSQAITRMYSLGGTMLEDIESTLSQYLIKFDKLKNKKKIPAPHNDFMRYKSLDEFMGVVEQLPDPDSEIEQQKIGAVQLPPISDWRYVYGRMDEQGRITTDCLIIQPLTKFGGYWWAKEYPKKGVTNRWCTAWDGDQSRFDYYAKQGPLFIIIPAQRTDDNEKYQFHFETKQFMDYQDHQIGDEGMDQLAKRFPALQQVFRSQAIQYNLLGLMTDDYKAAVRSHSKVASKELDSLIEQYKERIAGFGFSSLGDYGITIPEDTQRELTPLIENYLEQCRATLVSKDGFWRQVVNKLGTERNEDKLEVILNTDPSLKALVEQSEAGKAVAEIASLPNIKQRIDASHLQDLLLRDPLFRFTMRQVPKLYKSFLDELSGAQVNEDLMGKSKKWEFVPMGPKTHNGVTVSGRNATRVPSSMSQAVWREPTWSFREIAEKLGITSNDLKGLANTYGFPNKIDGLTSTYGSKSYFNQSEIKRWVNANDIRNVIKSKQAVDENNEYGDLGDDDGVADDGFFVVIANENDGAFIGMVTKDGGRWRETVVAGDAPGNWGGNYMSYLTPDDVMQHIRNDYSRHSQVKGPFYAEDQAMEYAERHFGLGDDSDYFDDEDDLEEGRVKDVDIQRQERDEMNPQQFRAGYGKSQSEWDSDTKDMFAEPAAPKAAREPVANKVEAYMEVYNKRDQREFVTMAFPTESAARKWANKHNAIVHSVQPINPMDEAAMDGEPEPEEVDNGLIGGRYDPDEFDAMVSRVGAKAKEQERKHGKVDIADLAKRLRAIDSGYDK